MIHRMVIFGATGDLTFRFLLPALAQLHEDGRLPDGFTIVALARVLRTGKALGKERFEVAVHLKPVPHLSFGQATEPPPNVLRLQLNPDRISLAVNINGPGDPFDLDCIELDAELAPNDLSEYGRLLLDILQGNPTFSIRADEAEESWRIVEPVLKGWTQGLVPLLEYPAGSDGPNESIRQAERF